MAGTILAVGLDLRELQLEVRFLQRQAGLVLEARSVDEVVTAIGTEQPRLLVLAAGLATPELIRLVRAREKAPLSILAIVSGSEAPGTEGLLLEAGANTALRRPLDRFVLESWVSKLLEVPRRALARIPVHVQVVGSRRQVEGEHFYGLTRNLSVHGMLLASPVRIDALDLDLELDLPAPERRARVLGRVVREAPEIGWPCLGYGIEFLFLPEVARRAIDRLVQRDLVEEPARSLWRADAIHSTLRRHDWIYEVSEPARTESGFLVEIRRAPRSVWRPGQSSPFHVVQARTAGEALEAAGTFVRRHG